MRFLFRDVVFCECGRPAMVGTAECRTCYEDALRRKWRDERRSDGVVGVPEPIKALNPLLRRLQAPEPEEDYDGELLPSNRTPARNGHTVALPLSKGGQGESGGVAASRSSAARASLTATR